MKFYIELDVWLEYRELISEIYRLTKKYLKEEIYGLVSQMKRCAILIPSNIAESCGRQPSKETIHFLFISRGFLYELETCKKLINGFINYYKNK